MDNDFEEIVRLCGPCTEAGAASSFSRQHCNRDLQQQTLVVHSRRLCWSTPGKALPQRRGPDVISVSSTTSRLTVTIFVNCVPNIVFQRQFSPSTGRSLPHASTGVSVGLTLLVTFCHHRTTSNQMDGPNALSIRSTAAPKTELGKILDNSLLACRKTPNSALPQQRYPAELFFGRKPRTKLDILLPT